LIDFSLTDINTEHPSMWSVAYVMLMAFVLSSCLAVVYHLTTPRRGGLGQFIQTMILGSLGTTIIVLAIGDSIGRGLGIFGALAIIRFRTTLRQQRDIIFVFSALGIGMACGVYGINIAVIGTVLFCGLAILFRFTPLHGIPQQRQMLRISFPLSSMITAASVDTYLKKNNIGFQILRTETSKDIKSEQTEITYLLTKPLPNEIDLIKDFSQLDDKVNIRIWSRNENDNE
jgi:uncharacterized membrane protein YhiD involved in acid resistance